jgi:hypothetical protein
MVRKREGKKNKMAGKEEGKQGGIKERNNEKKTIKGKG